MRVGARGEATKRYEYPGPRIEVMSNDVIDTPVFAARFVRHCRFLEVLRIFTR